MIKEKFLSRQVRVKCNLGFMKMVAESFSTQEKFASLWDCFQGLLPRIFSQISKFSCFSPPAFPSIRKCQHPVVALTFPLSPSHIPMPLFLGTKRKKLCQSDQNIIVEQGLFCRRKIKRSPKHLKAILQKQFLTGKENRFQYRSFYHVISWEKKKSLCIKEPEYFQKGSP